jgi:hypothetical protein
MYLHYGFFGDLNEYLNERVNALISDKQKGNLQILREYAVHRATVEQNVILNLVDWRSYFETANLDNPKEIDVKLVALMSDSDVLTFTVVLNRALKQCIDSYEENSEHCQILYSYYKILKVETANRPSLAFYPSEDGFKDCLETRIWRHKEERKLSEARELGNYCVHCGSNNVRSYNKQEWKCYDCGKRFRKH